MLFVQQACVTQTSKAFLTILNWNGCPEAVFNVPVNGLCWNRWLPGLMQCQQWGVELKRQWHHILYISDIIIPLWTLVISYTLQVLFLPTGSPASPALPYIQFINHSFPRGDCCLSFLTLWPGPIWEKSHKNMPVRAYTYTHTHCKRETLANNAVEKVFVITWGNCNSVQPLILKVR